MPVQSTEIFVMDAPQVLLSFESKSKIKFILHLSKIVVLINYLVSILSDCLDQDWCSVIVNGIESTICTQMKAQAECPVKCSSYLPNDDRCFTPGTN